MNDPACRSEHRPVLLLHGTLSTVAVDFPVLVPALTSAGFCVFGRDYGFFATQPVRTSSTEFADLVRSILTSSGADSVDVVGYSQGGLIVRTALRLDGLASVVHTAVLISPSFHGTDSPLIDAVPNGLCAACSDQAAGSALLTELNTGGDLDGAVRYSTIVTSADAVVTPWQSQLPVGPDDRVRSVVVDQQCPGLRIRHQDMPRTAPVVSWVVDSLVADGDIRPELIRCPT